MRRSIPLSALATVLVLCMVGCTESPTIIEPPTADPSSDGYDVAWGLDGDCGEPYIVPLLTHNGVEMGTVKVSNDMLDLTVTLQAADGWLLSESHAHAAESLEGFPLTKNGNPKVGRFLLSENHNPAVATWSYTLNLLESGFEQGEDIYLATHTVLVPEDGEQAQEAAWGDGFEFPGKSWATYFMYTVQICEEDAPATLTLLSPNDGALCSWWEIQILWESENAGPMVKIELFVNHQLCSTIVSSTENDGEYWWQPHQCCTEEEGCLTFGYTIVVTDLETGAWDESDHTLAVGEEFCGE